MNKLIKCAKQFNVVEEYITLHYFYKKVRCTHGQEYRYMETENDDNYPGYTLTLNADYMNTQFKLKLDISNSTLIFPEGINQNLKRMFDNCTIHLYTYQLENIIAEIY